MNKLKRLKIISVLLVIVLTLSMKACTKSLLSPYASNIVWSDCITTDSVISMIDSVSCLVHDDKLLFERYNHAEACGFDTILVDISIRNDTLLVYERVYPEYNNNCIRIINSSFQVNNVPHGTYTLIFKRNLVETIYSQTITL